MDGDLCVRVWLAAILSMSAENDRQERAIELLGEVYMGRVAMCDLDDDDDNAIRAHILRRLRRLCTIPDSPRLADVAKQTLKEVFVFRPDPPAWKRVVCGSKAAVGTSIAGP